LEEPPEKSILISENEEDIIQTIRSRCQILHFNGCEPIAEALVHREQVDPNLSSAAAQASNTQVTPTTR
jgi:DNA polymerase-3 subunit delta'